MRSNGDTIMPVIRCEVRVRSRTDFGLAACVTGREDAKSVGRRVLMRIECMNG
jgi:hypothetical protein